MSQAPNTPFALLQALERAGRDHLAELPAQDEVREEWSGIGFRLGGRRFVAPMEEVHEILTPPPMSVVPRTKSWVRGIANVRGTLLPIMDLNGYLGWPAVPTRLSRVVVIHQQGVNAGLVVDEVLGMRHFYVEERGPVAGDLDEALAPYVTAAFHRKEGVWHVFSMKALARHPQFIKVAG